MTRELGEVIYFAKFPEERPRQNSFNKVLNWNCNWCFPLKWSKFLRTFFYRTPQENASEFSGVAFCEITVFSCLWKMEGNIFLFSYPVCFIVYVCWCKAERLKFQIVGKPTKVLQAKALLGIGCKLNVYKTLKRHPKYLPNVLCTFNLCTVTRGLHRDSIPKVFLRWKVCHWILPWMFFWNITLVPQRKLN